MNPPGRDDEASEPDRSGNCSRRRVLASAATVGAFGLSGCVRQLQSEFGVEAANRISLEIKTTPTDADEHAIRIARFLSKRLGEAGVDAQVVPMGTEELLRDVLLNQQFDIYVARFPGRRDPDFLRPLLHSRFNSEPGWQNPFGYASYEMDDLLERQRRERGASRRRTLRRIVRQLRRDCPFTVVGFEDELRLTRGDRFVGWQRAPVHSVQSYLSLTRANDDGPFTRTDATGNETTNETRRSTVAATSEPRRLVMAITDSRPTENLNPVAAGFRAGGTINGLLYDSLGRWVDGSVRPWLAAEWSWIDNGLDRGPIAEVKLREDLTWHDGTPLTADDVAFTYRFLTDTSLGRLDNPVPAPTNRGHTSLVTSAMAIDDETVRFTFQPSSRAVAKRAFTAPILPRHTWEARTDRIAGRDLNGTVTSALVWSSTDPVGSGPLRVVNARPSEFLSLQSFEDHFLQSDDHDGALAPFAGNRPFDELRFVVVPSGDVAAEAVVSGRVDGTATSVQVAALPQRGLPSAVQRHVETPTAFYHVGFNARRAPLGNPRFRHVVSRLLDRPLLSQTAFGGAATATTNPLARFEGTEFVHAGTDESDQLAFIGERGDLDEERARERFRAAGYRYGTDGALLEG